MKKTYRKVVSLCLLLAVMFMIVGIAAADDSSTSTATSTCGTIFIPIGGGSLVPTPIDLIAVPVTVIVPAEPPAPAAA